MPMTEWTYRMSRLRESAGKKCARAQDSQKVRVVKARLGAALLLMGALPGNAQSNLLSLARFQSLITEHARTIQSFRIEGVVCAVVRERKLVALQDNSATVLLELPAIEGWMKPGECLAVVGKHCALTRSRLAIQLGTAAVVNTDGRHPPLLRSGAVYLGQGLQPFRLAWFNGVGAAALRLEYE